MELETDPAAQKVVPADDILSGQVSARADGLDRRLVIERD